MDIQSRFRDPERSFAEATAEEIDADLLEELLELDDSDHLDAFDESTIDPERSLSHLSGDALPELELEESDEVPARPDLDALEAALLGGELFQNETLASGVDSDALRSAVRQGLPFSRPLGRHH